MYEYGELPLPYPDELLYSVITRYHLRMNNSSPKWTLREVFGTENVIPTIDLPSHLDDLSQRSRVIRVSSDQWIDEHTLYSYYAPFIPAERRKRLRRMMKSNDGSGIHMMVGITASTIERNGDLRFCPLCYDEDIMKFGEPYWHRTHQAAGVMVCPTHNLLLHKITQPVSDRHGLTVLPIAKYLFQSEPMLRHLPDGILIRLQAIAQDVQLLFCAGSSLDLYDSRETLLHQISERGLLTPAKRIRQRELEEQFTVYYGKELLELLECMPSRNDYCWLAVATRKARRAVHPLRQLLLMRFLFGSFEGFQERKEKNYSPFGEGPWPCLNKAADHYHELLIQHVRITRCTDTGRPVGTFTCSCGFSYSRRGPDQQPEDRHRIGRIKAFGDVWKNQLATYMINGLSYRAAAKKLGVDTKTAIKYAKHESANEITSNEAILPSPLIVKTKVQRNTCKARNARVNWEKRDLELSWLVEEACKLLHDNQQTKPIRITIASVGKCTGKLALLERHKEKLPVTMSILANHLESVEQFQVRRIQWAAEQMCGEFPIKRWKLIRKAGLRPDYSNVVSEALDYYSGFGLHNLNFADEVTTQWLQ